MEGLVASGAVELLPNEVVCERVPEGTLDGTESVPTGTDAVSVSGGVAVVEFVTMVELSASELVLDRGPLGALNGTDPVSRVADSVMTDNVEIVLKISAGVDDGTEPLAAVPEEARRVPDLLSLVLLNGLPPDASVELANAVALMPPVDERGVTEASEIVSNPDA